MVCICGKKPKTSAEDDHSGIFHKVFDNLPHHFFAYCNNKDCSLYCGDDENHPNIKFSFGNLRSTDVKGIDCFEVMLESYFDSSIILIDWSYRTNCFNIIKEFIIDGSKYSDYANSNFAFTQNLRSKFDYFGDPHDLNQVFSEMFKLYKYFIFI